MRRLFEGSALYLNIVPNKFTFSIFLFNDTFYLLIFLWTASKSRITREFHTVKKTREFHDNESENIGSESIGGAALIQGQCLLTFLSQMRC